MGIKRGSKSVKENSWLVDSLNEEERNAAEFIAAIAASIQMQRKKLRMTQKELADKLHVSQAIVSRWENGEENFTIATLAKISEALDMELHNPLELQPA